MKRSVIEFLIGLPVVIGLSILFEYLYCTFITRSPFVFDIKICSIGVFVWFVVVIALYFIRRNKQS